MPDSIIETFVQFGAAGLIGLLWIVERRHATTRERQIDEAHRALISRQSSLDVLLDVVRDNTRAISGLQESQRLLVDLLRRDRIESDT